MTRNWLALMAAMPLIGQAPVAASRPVTVADSIEMNVASSSRDGLAYFSPDKSQFVVLTHKTSPPIVIFIRCGFSKVPMRFNRPAPK
jgi:hypothetical protein